MNEKAAATQYEVGSPAYGIQWLPNERSIAITSADSVGCVANILDFAAQTAEADDNHVVEATETGPSTPVASSKNAEGSKPSGSSTLRRLQKRTQRDDDSDDDNQIVGGLAATRFLTCPNHQFFVCITPVLRGFG